MSVSYTPPLKILSASAGSGKTFSLTVQFLILLFSGKDKYRQILAMTFTNKATAEMKSRLLDVLQALATGESKKTGAYHSAIQKAFPGMDAATLQRKAYIIYRQILHDYGNLSITTIDAFTQRVIKGLAYELGIDAGYAVEMNTRKVSQTLNRWLHEALGQNPQLMNWIIDYARNNIRKGEAWSYEKKLLTLSASIYSEKFQHLEAGLPAENAPAFFETLDTKITRTIQEYETALQSLYAAAQDVWKEVNINPELLKGKNRAALCQLNYGWNDTFPERTKKYLDCPEAWENKGAADPEVARLYSLLNPRLKALCAFTDAHSGAYKLAKIMRENVYFLPLTREMSRLLARYRAEHGVLLISDAARLIQQLMQDLGDNPTFIWEKTGSRYAHFLFDEFQDTSRQQWNNFAPLLKNALATAGGKYTEHLIVGDVKQSIYRWRNGDWRILLHEVKSVIGAALVEEAALTQNYRSDKAILDFNNRIFQEAPKRLQEKLNAEALLDPDFYSSFWQAKGYDRIIEAAYATAEQQLPDAEKAQPGIVEYEILSVENNQFRQQQVKEAALQKLADQLYRWIETDKVYRPDQIGILIRTNNEAAELLHYLMQDLQTRDNPHAYPLLSGGSLNLKENTSIQLILTTLRLLTAPEKEAGLYKSQCVLLYHKLKQAQTPDVADPGQIDWTTITRRKLSELEHLLPAELCRHAASWLHLPFSSLIEKLIRVYDLGESKANIAFLLAFADLVHSKQGFSPRQFLEWWDQEDSLKLPGNDTEQAVQIMTIHQSKGLAFDVVVLPFPGWDLDGKADNFWVELAGTPFDSLASIQVTYKKELLDTPLKKAYLEEKLFNYMDGLNTLYVAMTRAKHHLLMYLPGEQRSKNGLNTYLASDLVRLSLDEGEVPAVTLPQRSLTEEARGNDDWAFPYYPQGNQLLNELERDLNPILNTRSEQQRTGVLLHEVLSAVQDFAAAKRLLQRMHLNGTVRLDELPQLEAHLKNIFSQPDYQQLLSGNYERRNEMDILDADGKVYRPDSVFIAEEETIVLDFKFTGEEKDAHRQQMHSYLRLLREMGYPAVRGFLFYGFLNSFRAV